MCIEGYSGYPMCVCGGIKIKTLTFLCSLLDNYSCYHKHLVDHRVFLRIYLDLH